MFFQNQGAPLEVQSVGHDARGKVTVVQEQAFVPALGQNVTLSYNGLGPVVASFTTFTNPLEERFEQFRVDGYGNTYNSDATGEPLPQRTSYSDQNGRFLAQ